MIWTAEAMTAHNIDAPTWTRLAKMARLSRDAWSDAWLLVYNHPADIVPLTEETIVGYMRAAMTPAKDRLMSV